MTAGWEWGLLLWGWLRGLVLTGSVFHVPRSCCGPLVGRPTPVLLWQVTGHHGEDRPARVCPARGASLGCVLSPLLVNLPTHLP